MTPQQLIYQTVWRKNREQGANDYIAGSQALAALDAYKKGGYKNIDDLVKQYTKKI